jgi:hypothetical protein
LERAARVEPFAGGARTERVKPLVGIVSARDRHLAQEVDHG